MKLLKTKKTILFLFIAFVATMAILNYRTPFFKQNADYWSVGYGMSANYPEKMPVSNNPIYSVEKLQSLDSDTQFLADPFFIKKGDSCYIFFEHKRKSIHPAELGVLVSPDGKNYQYGGTILKEKFHLSYPQVFKYRNEYYMVPESQAGNNVILYKSHRFPYDWRPYDTLLKNIRLKDPTLFLSDTLNVMAATDKDMNMYLYQADSLFGKWTLNEKRPKVLMGCESRPGGRFYNDGNGLILPVQNARDGYGYGVSLYRLKFKDDDYSVHREKYLYLKGQPNIKEFNAGMHQLDIQKIDGKFYYVYDGLRLKTEKKNLVIYSVFKTNFYDLKNWVYQFIHN